MGYRNNDDVIETKGKIVGLKLNTTQEKSNGDGTFKAHILKIEKENGNVKKFIIMARSKAGEFVTKFEEGQTVTVKQKDDKYKNVIAVMGERKIFSGPNKFVKKEYDPTGPIQGMVLGSAVSKATEHTEEAIVEAAKVILAAKAKVDELVIKALKSRQDDHDDSDEDTNDESDDNDSEDEDDEDYAASKPNRKGSPY